MGLACSKGNIGMLWAWGKARNIYCSCIIDWRKRDSCRSWRKCKFWRRPNLKNWWAIIKAFDFLIIYSYYNKLLIKLNFFSLLNELFMHSLFIFLFKSLNFSHLFSRFSLEPAHCLRVILLRFQTIYCRYQHLHDTSKYSAGRVPFHIASQSFRSQQGQTHLRWWLEIYKVIPRLSFLRYFLVSCHFES